MHIDLSGGTNDAYLQEGAIDIADGATRYLSFYLNVPSALTMANTDLFTIFSFQSSGPADDGVIFLNDNSGTLRLGINETASTSSAQMINLPLGQWNLIEAAVAADGSSGTLDLYMNGSQVGSQIGSLNIAAIIQGRMGAIGIDSGSTAGHLYFDEVIFDDARTYGHRERFPGKTYWVTHSQHTHIGPGRARVSITGTSTDAQAVLYDTDNANNALPPASMISTVRTATDELSRSIDVQFNRGLYVETSGTNTQVFVEPINSIWISEGAAKSYTSRRAA